MQATPVNSPVNRTSEAIITAISAENRLVIKREGRGERALNGDKQLRYVVEPIIEYFGEIVSQDEITRGSKHKQIVIDQVNELEQR